MPTAKGAPAQKYRAMLVLYFEGSLEQQTLASHFLVSDWQQAHESSPDAWQHTVQSVEKRAFSDERTCGG
jgi:hypothetical protein